MGDAVLWQEYGGYLATLHPKIWKEVRAMAKTRRREFGFDLGPLFETLGTKRVAEALGADGLTEIMTSPDTRDRLTTEMRRAIIEYLGGVVSPEDRPSGATEG